MNTKPKPRDLSSLAAPICSAVTTLNDIRAVATGERQVANDDTEGMDWIGNRAHAGAIALLRCLPTPELEAAYRLAKSDDSDKGQESAHLIGREIIRRANSQKQGPACPPASI